MYHQPNLNNLIETLVLQELRNKGSITCYHITKRSLLPTIRRDGLVLGKEPNFSQGSLDYMDQAYGTRPLFVSLVSCNQDYMDKDQVELELSIPSSWMVADIPTLASNHGAYLDIDKELLWFEEGNDPFDDYNESGEYEFADLLDSSNPITQWAIGVTKTAAVIRTISPKMILGTTDCLSNMVEALVEQGDSDITCYHITKKSLLEKIEKEGLKLGQRPNYAYVFSEYMDDVYGVTPLFASLESCNKTYSRDKDPVVELELRVPSSWLVADVFSLVTGNHSIIELKRKSIWFRDAPDPLGFNKSKRYRFVDFIKPNTKLVKKAIETTGTVAITRDIPPSHIVGVTECGNVQHVTEANAIGSGAVGEFMGGGVLWSDPKEKIKTASPELHEDHDYDIDVAPTPVVEPYQYGGGNIPSLVDLLGLEEVGDGVFVRYDDPDLDRTKSVLKDDPEEKGQEMTGFGNISQ